MAGTPSTPERDALRRALEAKAPRVAARFDSLALSRVDQPYFLAHRIFDCGSALPLPSVRAHVALAPNGEAWVLTGDLDALALMVQHEPARGLDDATVKAYAFVTSFWSSDRGAADGGGGDWGMRDGRWVPID